MKRKTSLQVLMTVGFLTLMLGWDVLGNGIAVTNVTLANPDFVQNTVYVSFDLSWSNSWRNADNWDAAWVFVKFQAPGTSVWQHATLDPTNANHLAAVGSIVNATADGKGAFIYSSAMQTGSVSYTRMRLLWKYGANGYAFTRNDSVQVSVHAIEMVYVPRGAFYLGSGGSESGHFYQYTDGTTDTNAYIVSSEDPITVGTASNNLYYGTGSGTSGDQAGPIPAAFPKGYNAFYCMKYKVSEGQYANFLNQLTAAQTNNNWPTALGTPYRWTITGSWPNYSSAAPDRACQHLLWPYGANYAAWSGLRPMTELEYEKACRGAAAPVSNEYAWGSTIVTQLTGFVGTDGSGTETASPATANCNGGTYGPTRVGIFATAGSGRAAAGAGYYGAMELCGCLLEQCVTVGDGTKGRPFLGSHGSGSLSVDGVFTNADWPTYKSSYPQSTTGTGGRGGNWAEVITLMRTSDRDRANDKNTDTPSGSLKYYGWRAVRTAP